MRLKWDIENSCNLHCKHCIVGTTTYPKSISFQQAKEIIDKCSRSNVDNIVLSTKEPFMYPNITELIEYCSLYNIQVAIITNGTLITDTILEKLFEYSETINYIAISLEGVSSRTNDFVRGDGVFEKAMSVVNKIDTINKTTNKYIKIILQMNLTSQNYSEVPTMVKELDKFPFVQVAIGKLYIDGNAGYYKELDLDNKRYEEAISTLISTYKELDSPNYELTFKDISVYDAIYFNTIYDTSYKPNIPDCSIFYGGVSLMTDGRYCACSLLLDKELIENEKVYMGNVNDSDTISPTKKMEIADEYFSYKECSICEKCIFKKKCRLCLLIGLSDENREYQIHKCKFYMDKLNKMYEQIINNEIEFRLNNDVIITYNKGGYCVYNGKIGNIENWFYKTQNEEIVKVIRILQESKFVKYNSFNNKIDKGCIDDMINKLLYGNLLCIKKEEV